MKTKVSDLKITPLPLRVSDQRSVSTRKPNDEHDTHRSLFSSDCGNAAHVFNDDDAIYYAHCANTLPKLVEALKMAQWIQDDLVRKGKYGGGFEEWSEINNALKSAEEIETP